MAAFLAFAVVAVDLGRLAFTATEVQAVADIAATAAARTLLKNTATGTSDDPVAVALSVAQQNSVDGRVPDIDAADIQLGTYDYASESFVAGGSPPNAVRATPTQTVQNLVAAVLGDPETPVTKSATATFSPKGSGAPSLPIAVGKCHFTAFQTSNNCSDLPALIQVPSPGDNSCWTSLGDGSASSSQSTAYLPPTCCHNNSCGGGEFAPYVEVGTSINVQNGQTDQVLKIIESCVTQGMTDFVIPVIDCNNCNSASIVRGFATIRVTSVKTTGNPKGLNLTTICNTNAPGRGGGENFGTLSVAMVE